MDAIDYAKLAGNREGFLIFLRYVLERDMLPYEMLKEQILNYCTKEHIGDNHAQSSETE